MEPHQSQLPWGPIITAVVGLLTTVGGAIAVGIRALASGYVNQMNQVVGAYLAASTEQSRVLGEVAAGLKTMHEDHERQAQAHATQMTALQELCQHRDCPVREIRETSRK